MDPFVGKARETAEDEDGNAAMAGWTALIILTAGFALPLVHVAVSKRGGPFPPPPGARCPMGPRTGWIVLVLMLGPIGWLLYMRRRSGKTRTRRDRERRNP